MSAVAGAEMTPVASPAASRKTSTNGAAPEKEKEKRYKCQFCHRAFSRSEHRSRHERSRKSKAAAVALPASHPTRGGELCLCRMVGWRGTTMIPPPRNHH